MWVELGTTGWLGRAHSRYQLETGGRIWPAVGESRDSLSAGAAVRMRPAPLSGRNLRGPLNLPSFDGDAFLLEIGSFKTCSSSLRFFHAPNAVHVTQSFSHEDDRARYPLSWMEAGYTQPKASPRWTPPTSSRCSRVNRETIRFILFEMGILDARTTMGYDYSTADTI
jgi:hypothetical protein